MTKKINLDKILVRGEQCGFMCHYLELMAVLPNEKGERLDKPTRCLAWDVPIYHRATTLKRCDQCLAVDETDEPFSDVSPEYAINMCLKKMLYNTKESAYSHASSMPNYRGKDCHSLIYQCGFCGMFHVGSNGPSEQKKREPKSGSL